MMTRRGLTALVAVAALLVVSALSSTAHARPTRSYYRTHDLHSLDPRVAETLAWEICREVGSTEEDPCKVTGADDRNLNVLGPDEVHARIVEMLAERDPARRSARRFEVSLVRAAPSPGSRNVSADLPGHIRRALEGVSELMPDVDFEVLATGWLRTSERGEIRLADAEGNRYLVELHYRGLRTGLERTELTVGITATVLINNPRLRDLLATSLNLFVGETVVVGSSSGGSLDSAVLFLLLTATD